MPDFGIMRGFNDKLFGDKLYAGQLPTQLGLIGSQEVSDFTPILDTYPNAQAAFSLRLLRSLYTNSLIRVRRSSDNAEQDIGFIGANLDTTSLTTFCSGTNGFITTWYDQSGNGNNATQTTAANQPQIVSSGAVLTTNGKPSALFNGTSSYMSTTGTPFSATDNMLISVSKQTAINGNYRRLFVIGRYDSGRHMGNNPGSNSMLGIFNGVFSAGGVSLTQNITIMYNSGTSGILWQNGGQVNTATANNNNYGNRNLYLGTDLFLSAAEFWNGIAQEFIFYPTSQSSNVSGIDTNINSYYAIY